MIFNWNKKGKIFDPNNRFDWMKSHAQVPTILELESNLRIYFTCRPERAPDGSMVSYITYIDVEKENPANVIGISDKHILPLGASGSFDEFGVHPSNIIEENGKYRMYYQGWTREVSVPYRTSLGIAESEDGVNFKKLSNGPVLSNNFYDPYLVNGFFVYKISQNNYILFYSSCKAWEEFEDNRKEPIYHIKNAHSIDGIHWKTNEDFLIENKYDVESAGRPFVFELNGQYHMFFCYRNVKSFRGQSEGAYKLGYAYSSDLKNWSRDDKLSGIDLSETGWDSEMMAYPYIHKMEDKLYLFYNGNDFGKDGFGYAEMKIK